jgi:hypothetical protein
VDYFLTAVRMAPSALPSLEDEIVSLMEYMRDEEISLLEEEAMDVNSVMNDILSICGASLAIQNAFAEYVYSKGDVCLALMMWKVALDGKCIDDDKLLEKIGMHY